MHDNTRPRLNPAARPLWRNGTTIQIGLDPSRAVMIDSVDPAVARLLRDLDGTRSEAEILAEATAAGVDVAVVTRLLSGLRRHHLVVDGYPVALSALGGPEVAERLAPDHSSLTLVHSDDTAARILARRRRCAVVVHGAGRIGTPLASLLAASGVGRVVAVDQSPARLGDCAPAGLSPADQHRRRAEAAAEAVRRCAPEVDTSPLPPSRYPDLVVLTETPPRGSALLSTLHAAGVTHLLVGIRETTAVIGPMVRPGTSSCLRCADLHRCDRDPAWPALAAQLATPRRGVAEPCDLTLASLAATLGAMQVLTDLDGGTPAVLDGTLEVGLSDWQVRRRTWPAHPACGCGAWPALRAG
ncbi:MAG TPA: TOMM precursor leader peptide-binding protein [Mycobacteriales bacterium]|nr:TOMM precursor leader peptide-binding protein [Mycobacteriales bacterium]